MKMIMVMVFLTAIVVAVIAAIVANWLESRKRKLKSPFHLEYIYPEDVKRIQQEKASRVKKKQRSEFIFQGEPLYKLGRGHEFVKGFYTEYVTKTGIAATRYDSELWIIDNAPYEFKGGEFVLVPRKVYPTLTPEQMMGSWDSVSFPIVKNVAAKISGCDLVPVQLMPLPIEKSKHFQDEQH
jgi:hypothetical protein